MNSFQNMLGIICGGALGLFCVFLWMEVLGPPVSENVDLGKVDDIGTPSADPGVYNLSATPLPTVVRRRPAPPIALDLDEPYRDWTPLTIDKTGRLLGECIPTNEKLKVGTPYARMYFKINDINYLCERK